MFFLYATQHLAHEPKELYRSSRGAEDPKQLKNPPGQSLQHHCPHQPVAIPIIGGVFLYFFVSNLGRKTHQCPMPLFDYMAINGQDM